MSPETLLQVLAGLAAVHVAVALGAYLPAAVAALRRLRRRAGVEVTRDDLVLSVLRPMRGLDPHLEENLRSFAALDVPAGFEVLLLLDTAADEAYPLARRLEAELPGRFRVVLGAAPGNANPKVALMITGLRHARHRLIWMTDSNTETSDAHLRAHVEAWKACQLGGRIPTLVHAPLVAVGGSGLGAAFERVHLSTYNNVGAETTRLVGIDAVVGKSLLFHQDDLPAVGGLAAFGQASGEDYLMGRAFHRAGRVALASRPTRQVLGEGLGWLEFWRRQQRWAVVRKGMNPGAFYLLEPFSYFGLVWVWVALGLLPWQVGAAVFATKVLVDGVIQAAYSGRVNLGDALLVPFKDLALLTAWASAFVVTEVSWRGRSMKVDRAGNIAAPVGLVPHAVERRARVRA